MSDGDVEIWKYMGRRLYDGKLNYHWQDAEGKELVYGGKGMKGVSIGATYEVSVERTDDNIRARVVKFGAAPVKGDEEVSRWVLADREAVMSDDVRKAEARAKREENDRLGDMTLREIRDNMLRRAGPRRSAQLAIVLNYLYA